MYLTARVLQSATVDERFHRFVGGNWSNALEPMFPASHLEGALNCELDGEPAPNVWNCSAESALVLASTLTQVIVRCHIVRVLY